MKNRYLKAGITAGIIALIFLVIFIKINAQETSQQAEQFKILTEMCIDIKYIKNNIMEIKGSNKDLAEEIDCLDTRVTRVEERQDTIKKDVISVTGRNNWFMGFVGSLLLIMLSMQVRGSNAHRKENGEKNNRINKMS